MASNVDEKLSEAVRKYTCLYDKNKKSYKDKNVTTRAWKKVAEECEIEGGLERAKTLFENLKRRFAKRRRKAKVPSGASYASVAEAKEHLQELHFLAWLAPYSNHDTNCYS